MPITGKTVRRISGMPEGRITRPLPYDAACDIANAFNKTPAGKWFRYEVRRHFRKIETPPKLWYVIATPIAAGEAFLKHPHHFMLDFVITELNAKEKKRADKKDRRSAKKSVQTS